MGIFDKLFTSIKEMVSAGERKAEEVLGKPPTSETAATEPQKTGTVSANVEQRLNEKAQASDAKNWRSSIVDLMKLAGMDSSLDARRELAKEVGISDYHGTADQNKQLHREVMKKIQGGGIKLT
jgi:Domain of unknown function (DUF3597)